MTDRELLELAAKAAGYITLPHPNRKILRDLHFIVDGKNWNPLKDGGDALSLSEAIGIDIGYCHSSGIVSALQPYTGEEFDEPRGGVKRAIVRAAAEIGKGMP